jgi:uncharacterized membrane protein YcgQ (UPF0703/DUF1980 family)
MGIPTLLFGLVVFAGAATAQPVVTSVVATDVEEVEVNFDVAVDPVTGGDTANFRIWETDTPANVVPIDDAFVSGSRVTLGLGASLDESLMYTLASSNVEPQGGGTGSAYTETEFHGSGSLPATPIADIQANPGAYEGQSVTVEGIVYIPTDYRGSTISGYIQDESNRGINLFGNGFDVAATQTIGNRVRVTGTVEIYFTTVEITGPTEVTVLDTGVPRPSPAQLTTGAAANTQWEGTFIEVSGTIESQAVGGPGTNYTVNDGSGPIVVRVVDTLGAPSFSNGATITARGAGGQFSSDYQVNVGVVTDVFEGGSAEFSVAGATASDATTVAVGFSAAVDATTGSVAGNYEVYETATPANTVAVSSAVVSGSSVTLSLGASLAEGIGYTVEVSNVEDLQGNAVGANNTATFTYTVSNATPIADIQGNPGAYEGQEVTVEGIVYIPTNYRGSTVSGYIQDGSGRGINLFGNGFDVPATQTIGNQVRVTGTVEIYFTTVEIVDPTEVTILATGQPRPSPAQLTTGAAANSQWEGTFIEVTGPITAQAVGGPGINYTVNDGSGPIVVRVVDSLGAPSFSNGATITARGAGGQFQSDFQVNVGVVSDVFEGGAAEFSVTGASASDETTVTVGFSAAVNTTTGSVAGNYEVFETATPANTVAVSSAAVAGTNVTLTLGASLTESTGYTVRVTNVTDTGDNPLGANNTATFTYTVSNAIPIATIQANPGAYEGQEVTVEGIVYIPTNYRGSTVSGYIQDTSNRGINLFGNGFDVPATQTVGTLVRVTGTVELYFTTVEIVDPTEVTTLATGQPLPSPAQLTTGAAANNQWEGTFIEVTGPITAQAVGGPGVNYTVNDGSGPIVVRVVDNLGAPSFSNGTTITARGAGGQFQSDFQVNVGVASDVFEGGSVEFAVSSARASDATTVVVSFNAAVNATTGAVAGNYEVFETATPANTVAVSSAAVAGANVTLTLGASLVEDRGYTVRVSNVTDAQDNPLGSNNTATFTYSTSSAIPIATIQANPQSFEGQTVTVEGVVFIPSDYRGSTTSGYIQDESNRGINLFGFGFDNAAARTVGNRLRVTGVVEIYFTTVEITDPTEVTLLSSGSRPAPAILRTGEAASSDWEGTFIQVTGPIVSQFEAGGATNYSVNDGSGAIEVRVVDTLGAEQLETGTTITARGAGSQYQSTFQVLVGLSSDVFDAAAGPLDVSRASLETSTQVLVDFTKPVEEASATTVENYDVFQGDFSNPSGTSTVTSAELVNATRVRIYLQQGISVNAGWKVRVANVRDSEGLPMEPREVTIEQLVLEKIDLEGPPYTFLPRDGERYPLEVNVTSEIAQPGGEVILRIFDTSGVLVKTLFDTRTGQSFTDNRATIEWDGTDETGEWVSAGAYIAHLQVRAAGGSESDEVHIPVVVATRLDR